MWASCSRRLLHANWEHLIANTVPALVLGFLMTLAGMSRFIFATAIIWIVGGFGTWLIGNVGNTCGGRAEHHRRVGPDLRMADVPAGVRILHPQRCGRSSSGWSCSSCTARFCSVPCLQVGCTGISWQGHLCGAIAGVFAAYLLSGPERKARELRRRGATPSLTS